jgi:hypothetical protein
MNKNSGIDLPLLDGPEAILISIMEIQRALLDQRIPIKMGTALLYSLQLALQAKISALGLGHSSSVRECPELDLELEMERAKGMRPAKEKCAACPKRDDCLSPRNCRKLPKLPGYHRVGDRLVPDKSEVNTTDASTPPCHPERSAVVSRGAEGPFVSSPEATAHDSTTFPDTGTDSLRASSPERELGENAPPKFPPSRANARRQVQQKPTENGEQRTENPLPLNILGSNPNALLDLPGKFPQLAETKHAGN